MSKASESQLDMQTALAIATSFGPGVRYCDNGDNVIVWYDPDDDKKPECHGRDYSREARKLQNKGVKVIGRRVLITVIGSILEVSAWNTDDERYDINDPKAFERAIRHIKAILKSRPDDDV